MSESTPPNPVLWLAIGVPAATVLASVLTLFVAYRGADPELPAQYVTEGAPLDADLAQAQQARDQGITLQVDLSAGDRLHIEYRSAAGLPAPEQLRLRLTHATRPMLDRDIRAGREAGRTDAYAAAMPPLEHGHWLVQVEDSGRWRLRGEIDAPQPRWSLGAGGDIASEDVKAPAPTTGKAVPP